MAIAVAPDADPVAALGLAVVALMGDVAVGVVHAEPVAFEFFMFDHILSYSGGRYLAN